MVSVGVVALNALIAFLGDSYARVQERQVEATLSLKASLIVEYYNAAGPFAAMRERGVAWTHVLRVVKDDQAGDTTWRGQLTEIKDEMRTQTDKIRRALQADMLSVKQDVTALREMLVALGKHSRVDLASSGASEASTRRAPVDHDEDNDHGT
mmetsp:Transcript_10289/g.26761  ORF Transcript_10289/g.26761 Transcript_10289/m.26761 type:complete len:153 (+) Transcript_10289:1-459(+)